MARTGQTLEKRRERRADHVQGGRRRRRTASWSRSTWRCPRARVSPAGGTSIRSSRSGSRSSRAAMSFRAGPASGSLAGPGTVVVVPPRHAARLRERGHRRALVRVEIRPALDIEALFETAVGLRRRRPHDARRHPAAARPSALPRPLRARGAGRIPARAGCSGSRSRRSPGSRGGSATAPGTRPARRRRRRADSRALPEFSSLRRKPATLRLTHEQQGAFLIELPGPYRANRRSGGNQQGGRGGTPRTHLTTGDDWLVGIAASAVPDRRLRDRRAPLLDDRDARLRHRRRSRSGCSSARASGRGRPGSRTPASSSCCSREARFFADSALQLVYIVLGLVGLVVLAPRRGRTPVAADRAHPARRRPRVLAAATAAASLRRCSSTCARSATPRRSPTRSRRRSASRRRGCRRASRSRTGSCGSPRTRSTSRSTSSKALPLTGGALRASSR